MPNQSSQLPLHIENSSRNSTKNSAPSAGPTGGSLDDVLLKKTLVAGTDPVALDAYVAQGYWNLDPRQLRYLTLAQARGLGRVDFENVRTRTVQA